MPLTRIESELKEIKQSQREVEKILAVNTANLSEHMRRTDTLERRLDSLPAKALTIISLLSGVLALIKLAL